MKQSMIFVVTNGAGLGHLTRGLAVARKIREMNPEMEIIFVSTSLAVEVLRQEGFMFYYIPTRTLMPDFITPSLWNNYMKNQLREIVQIYNPIALVFDGAYPYGGIVANLKMEKKIKSFWIKREGYKDGNKLENLEMLFENVIIPKEAGRVYDGTDQRVHVNPIIMLDPKEAYPREELRRAWRVDEQTQVVYVQLGAGNINDIHSEVGCVVEGILRNPNYRVILGESIIGKPIDIKRERVSIIRGYPNAKYFKGIDFAVSAVGYNSYHELLHFGVPTLFVPNKQTAKDGQEARAMLAQHAGAALCLPELTVDKVEWAMKYMFTHKQVMKEKCTEIMPINGARETAEYILKYVSN
ncbi:MAG: glycosyltransferase [Cellulosilyticaceae bacterium]